ncbi:MAG: alpha/beta hydrolase [Chloroflexi bacterium]|nr:alpha/beta hydrolase [Chloroflexota bacterium]
MNSSSERIAWLNEQYSPSRTAHDFNASIQSYKAGTEAARAAITGNRHRVLAYGAPPSNRIECFLPRTESAPGAARRGAPIFAFLHGGWWQELSIDYAAAPAVALTDAGAIYASIGYTLTPAVQLREIVAEVSAALTTIAANATGMGGDPRRIVLAGHSAGAHLAATQLTALAPEAPRYTVAGLLLIGGAYDLGPIAESYVNEKVRMSEADAAALSPALLTPLHDVPVKIRVGEEEPEEFHRNAALLLERWAPSLSAIDSATLSGRDHFDALDELADPHGRLYADALELLGIPLQRAAVGR